jgi:signal transduction histidine kinase
MRGMIGLRQDSLNGINAADIREQLLQSVDNAAEIRRMIDAALEAEVPQSVEWEFTRDGQHVDMRLQTFLVTDSEGRLIGRGQFFQDITHDRDLDRMKDSLIATVSHELRTPLAAIKGYATTLLAKDVEWDHAAQDEFLNIISQETDRLSNLVNDLLDLSRIESGSLVVERSPCLLQDLVDRALRSAYPKPKITPVIEIEEQLPTLNVDPRKIEGVLRNLIENAVKYAESESPLRVSARRENNHVLISVCDQGPGIPDEFSDHIFTPFFRLEDGLKRDRAGAGLGLSICQGFVKAHGGKIWLEPRSRGTCISFTLPLSVELRHA